MRDKLPPYVVECFMVSGFNDIDAIVEMNTSDGSKNSIKIIESYNDKRNLIYQTAWVLNTCHIFRLNFHLGIALEYRNS